MASALDPETLRREVVGADGLIIRTGGVIDAAADGLRRPTSRWSAATGSATTRSTSKAATERGIQVVYTPGANTQSVCEHVFAMMIGLSKHFPQMMSALDRGQLPRPDRR